MGNIDINVLPDTIFEVSTFSMFSDAGGAVAHRRRDVLLSLVFLSKISTYWICCSPPFVVSNLFLLFSSFGVSEIYNRGRKWSPASCFLNYLLLSTLYSKLTTEEHFDSVCSSSPNSEICLIISPRSTGSRILSDVPEEISHRSSTILSPRPYMLASQSIIANQFIFGEVSMPWSSWLWSLPVKTKLTLPVKTKSALGSNLIFPLVSLYGLCPCFWQPISPNCISYKFNYVGVGSSRSSPWPRSVSFTLSSYTIVQLCWDWFCEASWLSCTIFPTSSSKEMSERPLPLHCTLYHHSASFKLLRVSYHRCSYSPSILVLDVYDTLLGVLPEPYSYSPSILLLDVHDTKLGLLSVCSYSPLILCLDVYDTIWDSFRMSSPCSCSAHLCPGYLVLNCRLIPCWMLHLQLISIPLGPTSSFIVPWRMYRCRSIARSASGLEELNTDDPLSVLIKGSTLISAADFKIVNHALVAVSITGVSSQIVIIISHGVIPLLRLYVVEIKGLLYDVCCLCIMIASILCLCIFRLPFVAANLVVLMVVNDSSFSGE